MEAMEREVQAVDSEFNQALQSEACRLQQLQRHTSAIGHPLNRFFWGNKKSLVDAMEKGVNLRKQIFKLYKDYYHGGLMKLVVIGGAHARIRIETNINWYTLLMCLRVGLRNYLELSERVLTVSGVEKIFDIIGFVYQYLKLLHQIPPQEWIFRELQSIGKMDFRFAEEQRQDDYAAELSENLLFYPPEHVMYGDYVYQTWDEQLIKQLLGFFIPENMRVEFGSRYVEEDIAQDLMELWRNPPEIEASLHLPSKNEFIPSDFSGGYANAQSCVLFELFILLLKDELNESYICIAMLETSVSYVGDKLELKVYGFNEKLPVLLSKVLSVARSFIPAGNRFEVIKEDMKRTLKNTNMKPLSHSSYLRLQVLCRAFMTLRKSCII
ncbi:hypothetical protein HN51_025659 [Arachis hypogaea]